MRGLGRADFAASVTKPYSGQVAYSVDFRPPRGVNSKVIKSVYEQE